MFSVTKKITVHTETAMNFTTPRPADKAEAQPVNPLWVITVMLAIFAAAAVAIIALG